MAELMSRAATSVRFACVAALAASCRSLEITPAALRDGTESRPERAAALERWTESIELANGFLASEFRRTLPAGRYELGEDGMRFVTASRTWPIRVVSSSWGDLVVRTGFAAQEREWGFVVGSRSPADDPLVDHSFFRYADRSPMGPAEIASLVLHETTHVVFREGTVGFWNGVAYYLEAIFLLRTAKHSDEWLPNATDEEFRFFHFARAAAPEYRSIYVQALEEHLAAGPTSSCTHGDGRQVE
jgi:hypothetical protein